MTPHDAVGVLEEAYAPKVSEPVWIFGVLQKLAPIFDDGFGVGAVVVDNVLREDFDFDRDWRSYWEGGDAKWGNQNALQFVRLLSLEQRRALFRPRTPATSVSEIYGVEAPQLEWLSAATKQKGQDMVGLICNDGTDRTLVVYAMRQKPERLDPRRRERLGRKAVHLSAGLRLLRTPTDAGEAVLDPSGRLLHAEGDAKLEDARLALSDRVVATERARGSLRRTDPDGALELWQGLVSGRWSLVDRYESDGRRYYVARENTGTDGESLGLEPVDQRVVALAVQGQNNRQIAYALGLSEPTVSRRLQQACERLRVRDRLELVTLATRLLDKRAPSPR